MQVYDSSGSGGCENLMTVTTSVSKEWQQLQLQEVAEEAGRLALIIWGFV
jgi:hypothetical protein